MDDADHVWGTREVLEMLGGRAKEDASERSDASHAIGASRRSGSRERVSGSPRGEAPRSKNDKSARWTMPIMFGVRVKF
jgi:hypothetical protein